MTAYTQDKETIRHLSLKGNWRRFICFFKGGHDIFKSTQKLSDCNRKLSLCKICQQYEVTIYYDKKPTIQKD